MIISIDFDGTIVEHRYPEIGAVLPGAFETMKALQAAGHRLILFTCREDGLDASGRKYLTEAVEFCRAKGIEFSSANFNGPDTEFRRNGGRKVYAHAYIDDRNVGGFLGWARVAEILLAEKVR